MFILPVPLPYTLYLLAGMLLLAPLVMWAARLSPAQAGWRVGCWQAPALGIGWGILLSAGITAWLRLLLHTGNYLPIPAVVHPADWAVLALAAPVVEEIFFRGVLFGGLQRSWSPLWAILLSAGIDTAVHSAQPWIAVHFAAAAAYALAFRQSGSLITPILAHALAVTALLLTRLHPAAVLHLPAPVLYITTAGALALIILCSMNNRRML